MAWLSSSRILLLIGLSSALSRRRCVVSNPQDRSRRIGAEIKVSPIVPEALETGCISRLRRLTIMIWRPTHVANSEPTVFKNVCPLDCPDTCSMRVTVQDGVAIDLKGDAEHPFTRGFLCQKMASYLDRVYSPDRLMFPMKRVGAKGAGKFERISWEEALDAIATRFAAIAASADGPQAILPYSYYGTMGKLQASSLDRRFFHRLGASLLYRSICAEAGTA